MLRARIIPCLLVHEGGLVKTQNFKDAKYVGDPINAVKIFNEKEADELMVLDIDASVNSVEPNFKLIEKLAAECRMPLCYGGGITHANQAARIVDMGVEKVELDELLKRADFITLHVPFTKQTANILSRENLAKTKKGVRIINCARGGLVDEEALAEALKSGHVAGAAFDVFANEPAKENALFNLPNVVCTPHLGAATTEAQENVALQVAEQMSDYLLTGAVTNALNMPSVTAEEAKVMGPWIKLADHVGNFIGQMTDEPVKAINILYDGKVSEMNTKALNSAAIAGVLKAQNPEVNMVSAPVIAAERGIQCSTTTQEKSGVFDSYIKLTVKTAKMERSIAGTVFSDGKPRFIQIKGINIDAEVGRHMLYTTNKDIPGIIGMLGQTMGENDVNIANFTLGRNDQGGDAIALLYLDAQPPTAVLEALEKTDMFQQVKPLEFDVS